VPSALAGESAQSLPITPGKWQFDLSTMMAMATEPQLTSRTQCITADRLDSATGKMEMHIMIGSHPVPIVTTWKAKRVGECEAAAE
jgi:hypothetical protein